MALVIWVKKLTETDVDVRFVMEATGVYHESLAYFLDEKGYEVSIVLPNKISNYFRTLEVKTLRIKQLQKRLPMFGLERKLDDWKRPKPVFKKLRQLTRERDQVVQARTMAKNHCMLNKQKLNPIQAV